jgi:Uma2 family endonuclease
MTMISHETQQEQEGVTPVIPADWVPGPRQGGWTYEMYAALPDDGKRYEVVQGVLLMSPAPEMAHQGVIAQINHYLYEQIFLKRRGLVLTGPVDVVLAPKTTVQPDVLVILAEHGSQVEQKRVSGAPDLAVEVISPGSATYDRLVKYSAYEQAGVPEYWLVNLPKQTIEVFVLEEGHYRSLGAFYGEQMVQSRLLPDAFVPAAQFFAWTAGLL